MTPRITANDTRGCILADDIIQVIAKYPRTLNKTVDKLFCLSIITILIMEKQLPKRHMLIIFFVLGPLAFFDK